MKQADRRLEDAQQVGAAQGPAVLQQDVVLLLDADAGVLAQDVQAVRKVLELNEFHLPIEVLLRNDRLQGDGFVAMPSSAIVEDVVRFFHLLILPQMKSPSDSTLHAIWFS